MGMPTQAPISQKEAKKQLQAIEVAAGKLLDIVRSAHPDVAKAWELARDDTRSDRLVPTYAKTAGLANAMAYVARCAQESRWLESLPSELQRGRPSDQIADALTVELGSVSS
jgi:hypothetical protein